MDIAIAITPYKLKCAYGSFCPEAKLIGQTFWQRLTNRKAVSSFGAGFSILACDIRVQSCRSTIVCDFSTNDIIRIVFFQERLKQ